MEDFPATISTIWDSYTEQGTQIIQSLVFTLSGYEMSELAAFALLIGTSVSFIFWLLLRAKRPKKISYLMEGGHRYYRP